MPTSYPVHGRQASSRFHGSPAQTVAVAVGAAFLLVGVLGFVTLARHHSGAALLGLFNVSVLHDMVHLGFGIAGIALARTLNRARSYLIVGGAVYVLLFVFGLVIDHDSSAGVVPVDDAENWLHLGVAMAMIALGVAFGRTPVDVRRRSGPAR